MRTIVSVVMIALVFSAMAKTTTLNVPATGGKWSTLTWDNGAPADGDTVYLVNDNASAVTVENDTASSLAALFTHGASAITLTGRSLSLSGDPSVTRTINKVAWNFAISNAVPLTIDVPVTVSEPSLWVFCNPLTFNYDVSVADDKNLCIFRSYNDGYYILSKSTEHELTFNGHLYATNATLTVGVYQGNKLIFNKSMHVKTHAGTDTTNGAWYYFKASGNTWTDDTMGVERSARYWFVENAHDPKRPLYLGTDFGNRQHDANWLYADQTVKGITSAVKTIGSSSNTGGQVKSDNYSTLFIRPEENCSAYCMLGGDDAGTNAKKLNVDFAAVGANAASVVQTLGTREHQMAGTLTVRSGTLRTEGTTHFGYLPSMVLLGGVFETACNNAAASPEFPALSKLHIASTARFRIDAASVASPFAANTTILSVENGGKIEIPAEMSVSLKCVIYNGNVLTSGTYSKANADWIEGDGEAVVSIPSDWNVWKSSVDGDWSTAANWHKGTVPTSSENAILLGSVRGYTVSMTDAATMPKQVNVYGFAGTNATLAASGDIAFASTKVVVEEGGVLSVPAAGTAYMDNTTGFTVNRGGAVVIDGAFAGKNLTANISGKFRVTGSFAVTNTTDNLFDFLEGADIEVAGGLFRATGSSYGTVEFANTTPNIRFSVTDNGVVDMFRNDNHTTVSYFGREFNVSDTASIITGGLSLSNPFVNTTNTFNLTGHAKLTLGETSYLYLAYQGKVPSVCEMNLASDQPVRVGGKITVGYKGDAVLNILEGQRLIISEWYGFCLPESVAKNQRSYGVGQGIVNIKEGSLVLPSARTSKIEVQGVSIGAWSKTVVADQTVRLYGVCNVYADGLLAVSNGPNVVVGCGFMGEGELNVDGGKADIQSDYNPLFGQWGGKGALNVSGGGLVCMKKTLYAGGCPREDLLTYKAGNWGTDASFANNYAIDNKTGVGTVTVKDGTVACAQDAVFSAWGTGSLSIGPSGVFVAKNVCLSNSVYTSGLDGTVTNRTVLTVKTGAEGSGELVCGTADQNGKVTAIDGVLQVAKGTKLVVDASEFSSLVKNNVPLVRFGSIQGQFAAEDIEFTPPVSKLHHRAQIVRMVRGGVDGYYLRYTKGFVLIVR